MMLKHIALATVISFTALATPAEAGWRQLFFWFDDSEDEPRAISRAYIFDDEDDEEVIVVPRRQSRSLYGDDLDYYEPRFEPQPKKAKKAATKPVRKDAAKKVALAPAKPNDAKPAQAKAASGVSCEKGATVVGDYGFSGVKSKSCAGKLFTYTAARGGKSYEVSLSALSGEITEVRKIP